jgi:hypothetical protein
MIHVLLVVEVLAPLDEVVDLCLEVGFGQAHQPPVVERVLVQPAQHRLLSTQPQPILFSVWREQIGLFLEQLCVFGVLVKLPQPLELFDTLLFGGEFPSLSLIEMKLLRLVCCP